MHIMIHLDNHLISETIYQLLITNGYDDVVVSGRSPTNGFTLHVLLVDITTLTHDLSHGTLKQKPSSSMMRE